MTSNQSRADVEMGNEENEELLDAEIPRVRMNPKNSTSREKQEHEDYGLAVYRSWCAACVEGRGVGGQHRIELLEEEERERTTPIVTHENADTFPILFCRDNRHSQTGATCCERKGPTAYFIPLLVDFVKNVGFRRIILKCDNEPSMKALQDAMIHSCVGADVIPQGPLEGDHMANGRVELAVREVKRQCRTLRISAEQNTSVRIADDSPLFSWLLRFAAQVMNKMRIGKDGKTSDMRRTGQTWRKPMAQFGEKVLFHKIGEEGISSFVKRMIQGIFVGHHYRTRAILYITKSGIVRGRSRTKQTLSDAWDSTVWEGLFDNPWHMVITETRLTKKVIADEEGTGLLLPRMVVEKSLEVERI